MGCCGGGYGGGLFRGRRTQERELPERGPRVDAADPEAILKARLARGEITVEEYRQLREVLREPVS